MKQIALALYLLLQLMSCNATEPSAVGPAKEPSHMDLWNKLVEDALKARPATLGQTWRNTGDHTEWRRFASMAGH
jgi:hypothetical protein